MSVPPQIIQVKRKATEEVPVSYLRVQETKRHRSSIFVYQRQNEDATKSTESTSPQIQKPVIHTSSSPARQATASPSKAESNASADKHESVDTDNAEPRRFHMSRKDMMLAGSATTSVSPGDGSKKRQAPALFVERKIRRISSRTIEKLHAASKTFAAAHTPVYTPENEAMDVDPPKSRKFKKPGVSRLAVRDKAAKPELPESMMNRWNVDMEQLTADMEAYALEQIGLNLKRAEEEKREQERSQKARANNTPSKLQFKPKPPAKRYAERHPKEAQRPVDKEMVDADAGPSDSSDDDGEYIVETYVRVPASSMGDHVPPQSVGLLVVEEDDVELFYGDDEDSEDEWGEDEEDENAENYYTADYPDEEVATDDEFGMNPYAFRTGNASDLEEYDAGNESDQFPEDEKPPEEEQVVGQFTTYIGRNGLRSKHL
ncbi:hypothetical protein GGR50DRAFT_312600 [Xylaria sp. CBS 124048]|nr:hypothetical protein GGR50DRAFT_312600 [Xylaria sp. CBS 124048]